MTHKTNIRNLLLTGLVICSLIGLPIHLMVHPASRMPVFYVPVISSLASTVLVPLLFLFRRTIHYGYVLNGMTVIVGTVTMVHYSINQFPQPFLFANLLYKTLVIDVLILGMKFCMGKALFDLEMFGSDLKAERRGTWYRYPNMGWWWIHLFSIGIVYAAGNILWRGL